MNDFTKDELMSLQFCMEVAMGGDSSIRDSRKELHQKIQSMIDNYCEHEHKHYSVGDTRPMHMTHECVKCGVEYT